MKVLVLGAGVIGVTSAWFLNKMGHEVTVVDRQPAPAMETSFANGGQISVSHAEPWANPGAPKKVLGWLMKEDAPLLFRLRADRQQWRWVLQFLRECTPTRTRHNIIQMINLGLYSRHTLQALRQETGIEYDCLSKGIVHFYTSAREFDAALEPTRIMNDFGCDRRIIDPDEAVRLEPALASFRHRMAGATYTPTDESGDAHIFTTRLAALCAQKGVRFQYETTVLGLETAHFRTADKSVRNPRGKTGDTLSGVRVQYAQNTPHTLTADQYVLALGSYSPLLVKPLGIDLLIYPAKGYSATFQIDQPELAPQVSLTDDEHKLVFSRLGHRLRVAGTAELNGYDTHLNPVRCQAIARRVMDLFPGAVCADSVQYWTGLRPATPSNVPYIGKTRYDNLLLNTGHGTLGWTHACGSGRALADISSGRIPDLDFAFVGL